MSTSNLPASDDALRRLLQEAEQQQRVTAVREVQSSESLFSSVLQGVPISSQFDWNWWSESNPVEMPVGPNWFDGIEPVLQQYVRNNLRVVLQLGRLEWGRCTRRLYIWRPDPQSCPQDQQLQVTPDELRRGLEVALSTFGQECLSQSFGGLVVALEDGVSSGHSPQQLVIPHSLRFDSGLDRRSRYRVRNDWGDWGDNFEPSPLHTEYEFQRLYQNDPPRLETTVTTPAPSPATSYSDSLASLAAGMQLRQQQQLEAMSMEILERSLRNSWASASAAMTAMGVNLAAETRLMREEKRLNKIADAAKAAEVML